MLVFEPTQHTGHPGARKGSGFWQKLRLHSFLVCLLLCSEILPFSSSESKSSTFLIQSHAASWESLMRFSDEIWSNLMQLLLHKSSTVEVIWDFHTIMVSFGRGDGRFWVSYVKELRWVRASGPVPSGKLLLSYCREATLCLSPGWPVRMISGALGATLVVFFMLIVVGFFPPLLNSFQSISLGGWYLGILRILNSSVSPFLSIPIGLVTVVRTISFFFLIVDLTAVDFCLDITFLEYLVDWEYLPFLC